MAKVFTSKDKEDIIDMFNELWKREHCAVCKPDIKHKVIDRGFVLEHQPSCMGREYDPIYYDYSFVDLALARYRMRHDIRVSSRASRTEVTMRNTEGNLVPATAMPSVKPVTPKAVVYVDTWKDE